MKLSYRASVLPAVLCTAWLLYSLTEGGAHPMFPSIGDVVTLLVSKFATGDYLMDVLWSLRRNMFGLIIGTLSGLFLGIFMGYVSWAGKLLTPTFNFFKQITLLAWIPLLSMWFGQGEAAKIVLIALASFYPMTVNTYAGMKSLDTKLNEVALICQLTPLRKLRVLIIPEAAPYLYTGVHLALIYSWVATIAAEYFFSSAPGVANIITDGRDTLDMAKVISGMVLIAFVGYVINFLFTKLETRQLHWVQK